MPPGGDGFFYFSTYLVVPGGEDNVFAIQIDNNILCIAYTDEDDNPFQRQSGCNAVTFATEGTMLCHYFKLNDTGFRFPVTIKCFFGL